jgi:hypothetical protein
MMEDYRPLNDPLLEMYRCINHLYWLGIHPPSCGEEFHSRLWRREIDLALDRCRTSAAALSRSPSGKESPHE